MRTNDEAGRETAPVPVATAGLEARHATAPPAPVARVAGPATTAVGTAA